MNLSIEIVSDLICPWCFIGKRKLEAALQTLRAEQPDLRLRVSWLPFELNPQMPAEGLDRKSYRSAKFGSWEKSQQLDAGVAQAGSEVGIAFDFAGCTRTPNTFDGHRLLWLAKSRSEEQQNALAETLFQAYFCDGEDVGDRATLARLAATCGLDAAETLAFLESDAGTAPVRSEQEWARDARVSGVPFFLFNRTYGTSGAQSSEALLAMMRQVVAEAPAEDVAGVEVASEASEPVADNCANGACSIENNIEARR